MVQKGIRVANGKKTEDAHKLASPNNVGRKDIWQPVGKGSRMMHPEENEKDGP